MNRFLVALIALTLLPLTIVAQKQFSDGHNEIMAIVDGEPITYQDVIGRLDLAAEIRTQREVRGISENISDRTIERSIVYSQLDTFIINKLLLGEARKVRIDENIKDSDVRAVIAREREALGIAEGDEVKWANYLQQKFGLTPSEYRERRRIDIIQYQMLNLMAGGQGSVPTDYPLSVFYPLSVTPRDMRKAFDAAKEQNKAARKMDYRILKLSYPAETSLSDRRKLQPAFEDSLIRARKGESLESASSGLKILIEQMNVPGVKLLVGPRTKAESDEGMDRIVYQMIVSLPATGGVSQYSGIEEEDEKGARIQGYVFVQLFSKEEGEKRPFDDPKVQAELRQLLTDAELRKNMAKVQTALLRRAVIVPEKLAQR